MKRFAWLLLVGLTVLLAACVEGEEAVVESTAVPIPSPTIESTANFRLKVPDAYMLIQLRMDPEQIPSNSEPNLEPLELFHLDYNDPEQVSRWYRFVEDYVLLIEHDLKYYYPQEISGAAAYLFPHHELSDWPAHYLFGRGVIDFLNTYGHSLNVDREEVRKLIFDLSWYRGKVLVRSIPMQLDNDAEKELLLLLEHTDTTVHERFSASAIIPVNITAQNNLQIIPSDFDEECTLGCRRIDITHDLNHDRQNDLLFYCERAFAYSAMSYQMVFSWNEEGVFRIGKTDSITWGKENPVKVDIFDTNSDGYEEIVWRETCEGGSVGECNIVETFSLEDLMKNSQQTASTALFSEETCEQLENEFCLYSLGKSVLAQTDPAIPEKITQLLNYLPADDPEAQPYIEHLTYLLGYFYELSGDEENAVSTYLDLVQQYPASPWSWLAWARLAPVED